MALTPFERLLSQRIAKINSILAKLAVGQNATSIHFKAVDLALKILLNKSQLIVVTCHWLISSRFSMEIARDYYLGYLGHWLRTLCVPGVWNSFSIQWPCYSLDDSDLVVCCAVGTATDGGFSAAFWPVRIGNTAALIARALAKATRFELWRRQQPNCEAAAERRQQNHEQCWKLQTWV